MNFILSVPLWVRLLLLGGFGILVGTQLNRGIYRLAWFHRAIGPWSAAHPDAPARSWLARVPVLGWFSLRSESEIHGRGFWIRPILIELLTGFGFAGLYWFEVDHAGIYQGLGVAPPGPYVLHSQYLAHITLISLMIVATFIDFDEQTIPDTITTPGTILGLLFAALMPASFPLATVPSGNFRGVPGISPFLLEALNVASPAPWPDRMDSGSGLIIGVACLVAWCLAITPWLWTTRSGLIRGAQYLTASLVRRGILARYGVIAVIGSAFIAGIWWTHEPGSSRWPCLFTALVGMTFGGGLIWAVRIIGSRALGQEAMGFGDVTLMAMIGTFTGWQATLMIFFLAPFAALFIATTQWLLTRRKDIAFGPYLCVATLFLILNWGSIWHDHARRVFALGMFIPLIVACGLALMWAMLTILRFLRELRERAFEDDEEPDADSILSGESQGTVVSKEADLERPGLEGAGLESPGPESPDPESSDPESSNQGSLARDSIAGSNGQNAVGAEPNVSSEASMVGDEPIRGAAKGDSASTEPGGAGGESDELRDASESHPPTI